MCTVGTDATAQSADSLSTLRWHLFASSIPGSFDYQPSRDTTTVESSTGYGFDFQFEFARRPWRPGVELEVAGSWMPATLTTPLYGGLHGIYVEHPTIRLLQLGFGLNFYLVDGPRTKVYFGPKLYLADGAGGFDLVLGGLTGGLQLASDLPVGKTGSLFITPAIRYLAINVEDGGRVGVLQLALGFSKRL